MTNKIFSDYGDVDENSDKFLQLLRNKGKENLPFACKFLYRIPENIHVTRDEAYGKDHFEIKEGTLLCVRSFHGPMTKVSASNFNFCRFSTGLMYTDDGELEVIGLRSKDKDVSGLCWWKQKKIKFKIEEVEDNTSNLS